MQIPDGLEREINAADFILIADGSGAGSTVGYGWGLLLIDTVRDEAVSFCGAGIRGTNNLAELLPFLHGLWWIEKNNRFGRDGIVDVVCISDSQVTVGCGNRKFNRGYSPAYWAAINWYESNGYRFSWLWKPRKGLASIVQMDRLGRRARIALEKIYVEEQQVEG